MSKTAPFSMRLPPELKDQLHRLAERDRRSLTNYIEKVLVEHVDARAATEQKKARQEDER
jgi:predicted transcriptional regulator